MANQNIISAFIKASLVSAVMLLIWYLGFIFLDGEIWQKLTQSKSAIEAEYCEFDNKQAFFRQKLNTFSNLIYFFMGVFILNLPIKASAKNLLERFNALNYAMAFAFIYLSFGSALFHASLSLLGQRIDMNGTYGISIVLLFIAFYHIFNFNFSAKQKQVYVILIAMSYLLFLFIPPLISSSILVPSMVISILILKIIYYLQKPRERYFLLIPLSFVIILLALKIRTLDVMKIDCDPFGFFQGHSLWHVLTAFSTFLSYAFFRFMKN
jgi:hypothetical protein